MASLLALVLFMGALELGGFSASAASIPEIEGAVYRLYEPNGTGEHLYTMDRDEATRCVTAGWRYEGVAWYSAEDKSTPVYRLHNNLTGEHHYTTASGERDYLVAQSWGWVYDGIGWYAGGDSNVYRLNNPNAYPDKGGDPRGAHHFTFSMAERDYLISVGWEYEGVAWAATNLNASSEDTMAAYRDSIGGIWGSTAYFKGMQQHNSYSYTDDYKNVYRNIHIVDDNGIDAFTWEGVRISENYLAEAGYPPERTDVYDARVAKYEFEGKVYYFNKDWVRQKVSQVKKLNDEGKNVHVCWLMEYREDLAYMVDEDSRVPGHSFYLPASTGEGAQTLKAFWNYFTMRLNEADAHIDNWIFCNEANTQVYCYEGSYNTRIKAEKYAAAFMTMYNVVNEKSSGRCSICLDHCWNLDWAPDQLVPVRDFLAYFVAKVGVDVDWYISFHMYPARVDNSIMWDGQTEAKLTLDTMVFDATNLGIITNYIKNTYGAKHRIMLTEDGAAKGQGEANQAASLAYAYYAAYYNDMIDCIILNLDATVNEDFSLYPNSKVVWDYLSDGNPEHKAWLDDYCLKTIGVSSWSQIIPNYGG